jgi:hypothetical protein
MVTRATPVALILRSYQVGFGDCLLLTVTYDEPFRADAQSERHMLIDFGTKARPKKGPTLLTIAKAIAGHTGGQLDVLVATHRHQDHISGFGDDKPAAVIDSLRPRLVVRPWTDHPNIAEDAIDISVDDQSIAFASHLQSAETLAGQIHAKYSASTSEREKRLAALAALSIANKAAVENLEHWATTDRQYVKAGDRLRLTTYMPGVTAHVLGPPTLKQVKGLTSYASSSGQYWIKAAGLQPLNALAGPRRPDAVAAALDRLAEPDGLGAARWLVSRLENQEAAQLLSIVQTLDDSLNNTSIVLLLKVGTKRLLLAGDAQLENWSHTLTLIKKPTHAELRDDLANIDLYKVGHHGSKNATPMDLYDLWRQRSSRKQLLSVLSTLSGVFDETEEGKVPKPNLVKALGDAANHRRLVSTEQLRDSLWIEVTSKLTPQSHFSISLLGGHKIR